MLGVRAAQRAPRTLEIRFSLSDVSPELPGPPGTSRNNGCPLTFCFKSLFTTRQKVHSNPQRSGGADDIEQNIYKIIKIVSTLYSL